MDEPADRSTEWDRDGQYFHYLTKWMQALARTAAVTLDLTYLAWALELAEVAFDAFVHRDNRGGLGIYWKMSTDLSRPVVTGTGQLDPLDGLVTFADLQAMREDAGLSRRAPTLASELPALRAMCIGKSWMTADSLGIGGSLADASRLAQLIAAERIDCPQLLRDVLVDAERSLMLFTEQRLLERAAIDRLAFRELGLAMGIRGIDLMRRAISNGPSWLANATELAMRLESLARYSSLADSIESYWLDPTTHRAMTWFANEDIDTVMLAACLLPDVSVRIGCESLCTKQPVGSAALSKGA